jgi:hypothetical protein
MTKIIIERVALLFGELVVTPFISIALLRGYIVIISVQLTIEFGFFEAISGLYRLMDKLYNKKYKFGSWGIIAR